MSVSETFNFKDEFKELVELENEMNIIGKSFEQYYNIFTPEFIKKRKIIKDELLELFPSNLEIIRSIHSTLKLKLFEIQTKFKSFFEDKEENKEIKEEIIIQIVNLYDEYLESILGNYTSVYRKLCVALYTSEHSFPKLPKKTKINKDITLAKVYVRYIEYVSLLFKYFVGIVRHLSVKNSNWDKSYDVVYGLQIVDSTLKPIYSSYPNIIKIMNLRKHFKCVDFLPIDRTLIYESQIKLKSHKIEVLTDEEFDTQWVEQSNSESNLNAYCFIFEDTIVLITSDEEPPLQFWLNDCHIENLELNDSKIFDQSEVKKESVILSFDSIGKKKEWIDVVLETQTICKTKRLFGKKIDDYVRENESDDTILIPQAIEQCFYILDERGISEPFIFKRKGDGKLINKIIPLINLGKEFEISDVSIAADIIKIYLRNLPEPLLLYDSIPQLSDGNPQENIVAVIQYIDKLPLHNKALLNRLMKLCHKIALNRDETKMNSLTLAKILAPNLCWSTNEGITGNIYTLVEILITEYIAIFKMIDKSLEERQQAISQARNENQNDYFLMKEKLREELLNEENGEVIQGDISDESDEK